MTKHEWDQIRVERKSLSQTLSVCIECGITLTSKNKDTSCPPWQEKNKDSSIDIEELRKFQKIVKDCQFSLLIFDQLKSNLNELFWGLNNFIEKDK